MAVNAALVDDSSTEIDILNPDPEVLNSEWFAADDPDQPTGEPADGAGAAAAVDPPADGKQPEPPPAAAPAAAEPPKASLTILDGKLKLGDTELTTEQAAELIVAGQNVSEQQRVATQKFQEAADLKRQAEEGMGEFQAVKELGEWLRAQPPEVQRELVEMAGQIEAKHRGGGPAAGGGDPAPAAPAANQTLQPMKILEGIKREELNEFGQSMLDAMNMLAAQNASLVQIVHGQEARLKGVAEVVPDIKNFVTESRTSTAVNAAQTAIKTTHALDIPAAEIEAAMKATGITDPEAAWLKQNSPRLAEAAAARASQEAPKGPQAPNGESRTFSMKGKTADQIAAMLNQGYKVRE